MADIADALMQLLLDNATARPLLETAQRRRALAAATLLDLALACRIRPATEADEVPDGSLVVLAGPDPEDAVLAAALRLLSSTPLTPAAAVTRLARNTEERVIAGLRDSDRVAELRLRPSFSGPAVISGRRLRRSDRRAWLLRDRGTAAALREELLTVLVDGAPVRPPTAALIAVLYSVDGLHDLLSLEPRVWLIADERAAEIASATWVLNGEEPSVPEMNLAVTAAAVCGAL
ncbi:GPP34 family phosphoprotein [Mycolicibacterium brumae]|uniref:GPP34 family phosphoprotein n=1 Tax=Mycolicibacterium brumae TaxID=85968 RepID=A0A2G5PFI7_9MYCO|nr:GPP34 family phosphoprotein [Mycolicibacterium brumae]MCV7191991.1 GPP34 family phosphoprotein [Mycolicibacterium brumae]PIB76803.1 GPP34 family phosphoprotein [Mycolicibacterium brumae]RWA20661.1 hypothetical protein MBRU_03100 [Mycolicibacterium brumae DSM 44177]UWW07757.1 GPP34 family phosphoprotein [Mycolicibacterium brumae]